MSFIRRNLWGVGFVVVLGGALIAMWLANRSNATNYPTGDTLKEVEFSISADDNVKGPQNAKVTLVEFSDFQCPACKAYAPVIDELLSQYPNDLRLVYKHFPLKTIHMRAMNAAQASEAAGRQGKFFEMAKILFDNQDNWSRVPGIGVFESYAENLGLNIEQFKNDYGSDEVRDKINGQLDYGISLNVNSTPTIYLNGKKIENPASFDAFRGLIEAEINKPSETTVSITP